MGNYKWCSLWSCWCDEAEEIVEDCDINDFDCDNCDFMEEE